ncbi:hypothetical protein BKA70DRAFT_1241285 [Coprinopsis sp. MPI-PUGE-AT-0042]|nr:hypothetical protein BKA70DRAFT_1241285 [Coprinopsis sp. MPI-PUGE-AT-0042]
MSEDLQRRTPDSFGGSQLGVDQHTPRLRSSRSTSRAQRRHNPLGSMGPGSPNLPIRAARSSARYSFSAAVAPGTVTYRAISPPEVEEGLNPVTETSGAPIGDGNQTSMMEAIVLEDNSQKMDLESLRTIIERQKRQLRSKVKSLERAKEEVAQLKQLRTEIQQELDEREEELANSKKNEEQYRNWWLNEIQFTKLLLNKIPDPNRDIDLMKLEGLLTVADDAQKAILYDHPSAYADIVSGLDQVNVLTTSCIETANEEYSESHIRGAISECKTFLNGYSKRLPLDDVANGSQVPYFLEAKACLGDSPPIGQPTPVPADDLFRIPNHSSRPRTVYPECRQLRAFDPAQPAQSTRTLPDANPLDQHLGHSPHP